MRFVRTILACAIAVSLAMLPLGASAGIHAMPSDDIQAVMEQAGMQHSGMHMAGHADMVMDACCPDDVKGKTSHSDGYKCGMGLCCVGGALALGEIQPISLVFLAVLASKVAIPADQVVSFRGGSPPFRPPRV